MSGVIHDIIETATGPVHQTISAVSEPAFEAIEPVVEVIEETTQPVMDIAEDVGGSIVTMVDEFGTQAGNFIQSDGFAAVVSLVVRAYIGWVVGGAISGATTSTTNAVVSYMEEIPAVKAIMDSKEAVTAYEAYQKVQEVKDYMDMALNATENPGEFILGEVLPSMNYDTEGLSVMGIDTDITLPEGAEYSFEALREMDAILTDEEGFMVDKAKDYLTVASEQNLTEGMGLDLEWPDIDFPSFDFDLAMDTSFAENADLIGYDYSGTDWGNWDFEGPSFSSEAEETMEDVGEGVDVDLPDIEIEVAEPTIHLEEEEEVDYLKYAQEFKSQTTEEFEEAAATPIVSVEPEDPYEPEGFIKRQQQGIDYGRSKRA